MEKPDKKNQVRERIAKAAMDCFAKYGLEKTTLDDIAGIVGMKKSSLFYYFPNKESLFLEVAFKEGQAYLGKLQTQTLRRKGFEAQTIFYLKERYNYYHTVVSANRVSVEMIHRLLPGFLPLYSTIRQREVEFLAGLVRTSIQKGEISKVNPTQFASHLLDLSDSIKHFTEQNAILEKADSINYHAGFVKVKALLGYIFKGLEPKLP